MRREYPGRTAAAVRATGWSAFTLVEALATLALIAVVIPAVLGAVSVATRSASVATSRVEATMLAEAKLEEIIATRSWEDGATESDFAYTASGEPFAEQQGDGPGPAAYRWELTVEESFEVTLRELRLRVIWEQHGRERSVELVTLIREET